MTYDIAIRDIISEMLNLRLAPYYTESIEKEYTYKYFVDFTYTIIDKHESDLGKSHKKIDLDDYDEPTKIYYTKVRSVWDEDDIDFGDTFASEDLSYQPMKAWDDKTRKEAYLIFDKKVQDYIKDYQVKFRKDNEENIFGIPWEERETYNKMYFILSYGIMKREHEQWVKKREKDIINTTLKYLEKNIIYPEHLL